MKQNRKKRDCQNPIPLPAWEKLWPSLTTFLFRQSARPDDIQTKIPAFINGHPGPGRHEVRMIRSPCGFDRPPVSRGRRRKRSGLSRESFDATMRRRKKPRLLRETRRECPNAGWRRRLIGEDVDSLQGGADIARRVGRATRASTPCFQDRPLAPESVKCGEGGLPCWVCPVRACLASWCDTGAGRVVGEREGGEGTWKAGGQTLANPQVNPKKVQGEKEIAPRLSREQTTSCDAAIGQGTKYSGGYHQATASGYRSPTS